MLETDTVNKGVEELEFNGKNWKIPYEKYRGAKVIDWNSPIWKENPSEGKIIISAKDTGRFIGVTLKPFTDEETGVRIGWGTGEYDEKSGQPILGNRRKTAFTTNIDLSKMEDRKLYIFMARNPMVSKGPNTDPRDEVNTMLVVDDKEKSSRMKSDKRKMMVEALLYVDKCNDDEVFGLARLAGMYKDNDPIGVVREALGSFIEADPKAFMELKDSKDRPYQIAIADGGFYDLIKFDPLTGFNFKGISLGMMKTDVIKTLKESSEVYKTLCRMIEELRAPNESTKPQTQETATSEVNTQLEEMKRKLAEAEAEKEKYRKKLEEEDQNEEIKDNVEVGKVSVDDNVDLDKITNFKKLQSIAVKWEIPNDEYVGLKTVNDLRDFLKKYKKPKKTVELM